jgi:hypothetical protein
MKESSFINVAFGSMGQWVLLMVVVAFVLSWFDL